MSDIPTREEITAALDVIERATAARKATYTIAQARTMTTEQVRDALEQNPAAFDAIEEAQS